MRRLKIVPILVVLMTVFMWSFAYAGTVGLPKTGQTTSYGTRDDGALQRGVAWPSPRFTDNNNGTITDNLTGLIWLKNAGCLGYASWANALDLANALAHGFCGLTDNSNAGDWRLPNVNELESLVHAGQANIASWLNGQGFTNVQASNYWSSTTHADSTGFAWYVYMYDSGGYAGNKALFYYVWPVRAGQSNTPDPLYPANVHKTGQTKCYDSSGTEIPCENTGQDGEKRAGVAWSSPRFTDNNNGTITDNLTGLIWLKNANCFGFQTWANALNLANTLAHGSCGLTDNSNAGDWRLPNRKEIRSLINYGQINSATWLNTQGFSSVQADVYWSSTTYADDTGFAWYIFMVDGVELADSKTYGHHVWPVRAGSGSLVYLVISKSGTGAGTVTSSPAGINCGSTCTASFNSGTSVTLTASPASGSTFAGWSGACSGTGTCTLTMDAAKNVTATFNTQTCTYTISPTSLNTGAGAVTGNINVTTASGCTWTAVSNASWITITSGNSGTGSGTVTYTVSANSGTYRTGTITVGGQTHTVSQSDTVFADVDSSMWSKNYIEAIYNNEITIGCIQSPIRYYCPLSSVTRGQMAAFIIRAKYGKNFTYPTTPYFSDVPANNDFFKYVQRLKQDNITRQEGIYRVNDPVTRGEMAALIIRAKYGDNFTYPTTAYFSDVPSSNTFFTYVQRLKQDNITRQEGIYRVNDAVSREEMAAFISRAFLGME